MKPTTFLPFFLVVTLAVAQQPRPAQSLSYSGLLLKLKDAEQPTIERLQANFKVQPLQSNSGATKEYLVTKKNSDEVVGVITFRGETLVKAYRDWTPVESSAYALVVAIKGAIDALKKDGFGCAIETGNVQEPNYSNQGSYVVCGNKSVEITAIQSSQLKGGTTVSVYEYLTDPSER